MNMYRSRYGGAGLPIWVRQQRGGSLSRVAVFGLAALLLLGCAPAQQYPSVDTVCEEPRPEVCTANYVPVCGIGSDGARQTYPNGCSACSNAEVYGYLEGPCE